MSKHQTTETPAERRARREHLLQHGGWWAAAMMEVQRYGKR